MPVIRFPHATGEPQTLDEVLEYHRDFVSALQVQRSLILQANHRSVEVAEQFRGMTKEDVEAWYVSRQKEIDRLTVLSLVASAEASIRSDFFRRIDNKLKDQLSTEYRAWHKTLKGWKRERPDFDKDGILDTLKAADVMDNHVVGRFRECLKSRHWVGHGRFWARPAEIGPSDVYQRADSILQELVKL